MATDHDRRRTLGGAVTMMLVLAGVTPASAAGIDCERGIARASNAYLQTRVKALARCEDAKVRFRLRSTIDCPTDALFQNARDAAMAKLYVALNNACGGADRVCGTGDDVPLADANWAAVGQCPDYLGTGCTNPIANCQDIAQCLRCMNDAAAAHALHLYYGAFDSSVFGSNGTVNRCQRGLGKAAAKYLVSRSRALARCWDARLAGLHSNPCPNPGDGRAGTAIAKAEAKKQTTICKACGGADATCNGSGDVALGDVGFVPACPPVDPLFPASSCTGSILDMQAAVDCVDCVSDFDADCAGATSVPAITGPLPASCRNGSTTTTTVTTTSSTSAPNTTSSTSSTSPTTTSTSTSTTVVTTTSTSSSTVPTTTSTTASTTTSTSSTSTTSTSTTTSTTTTTFVGAPATAFDFLSTAGSGTCGQTFRNTNLTAPLKNIICGNLSLGGGQSTVPDNVTPPGSTNRFSLACTGANCTVGPVATAGAGYDCSATGCRFGTPLPIANGALSVCVQNFFSQDVTGTLDRATGSTTLDFELRSHTILTTVSTQPCPLCRVGSVTGAPCAGSPGAPCTGVCDGSPNQGAACVSTNPSGLTSACPAPAPDDAASRCYKGTNNNQICIQNSDCTGGGVCAQFIGDIPISLNPLTTGTNTITGSAGIFCPGAGQTSAQAGAFKSDICRLGTNNGKPCTTTADCPGGSCRSGTFVNYCSAGTNNGLGCATNAECGTGGVCSKAGTLAQAIQIAGQPAGPLTSTGVPTSMKMGATFCVAETSSAPVNSSSNLPGPGATVLAGTVTLIP